MLPYFMNRLLLIDSYHFMIWLQIYITFVKIYRVIVENGAYFLVQKHGKDALDLIFFMLGKCILFFLLH